MRRWRPVANGSSSTQTRGRARSRWVAPPPRIERVRRVRADRPERRRTEAHRVEHLGRPERDDDVRLAVESAKVDALGHRGGEMVSLGVEAARYRLDIRESRPVLEVQEGATLEVPGDDVRPARELVVLVRLVDTDREPATAKVGDLQLAHGRVDQVGAGEQITCAGAGRRRRHGSPGRALARARTDSSSEPPLPSRYAWMAEAETPLRAASSASVQCRLRRSVRRASPTAWRKPAIVRETASTAWVVGLPGDMA